MGWPRQKKRENDNKSHFKFSRNEKAKISSFVLLQWKWAINKPKNIRYCTATASNQFAQSFLPN